MNSAIQAQFSGYASDSLPSVVPLQAVFLSRGRCWSNFRTVRNHIVHQHLTEWITFFWSFQELVHVYFQHNIVLFCFFFTDLFLFRVTLLLDKVFQRHQHSIFFVGLRYIRIQYIARRSMRFTFVVIPFSYFSFNREPFLHNPYGG